MDFISDMRDDYEYLVELFVTSDNVEKLIKLINVYSVIWEMEASDRICPVGNWSY